MRCPWIVCALSMTTAVATIACDLDAVGDPIQPSSDPAWLDALRSSRAPSVGIPGDGDAIQYAPVDPLPTERSHGLGGMGAMTQLLMDLDGAFDTGALWRGALTWTQAHAMTQPTGYSWPWIENDPVFGGQSSAITATVAMAFSEGFVRDATPSYAQYANGALDWVASQAVDLMPIIGSPGWIWIDPYPAPEDFNLGSYSTGAIGRGAADVYRATGHATAMTVATQAAETYRSLARADATSGGWYWGFKGGPGVVYTAFCNGASGIAEFLVEMSVTFPATTWYEDYARGALAWLSSVGVVDSTATVQPARKWPKSVDLFPNTYLTHAGWGAAGVGRAFLAAYHAYGDAAYLEEARAAGNYLVSEAVEAGEGVYWPDPAPTPTNRTTWCRGELGVMQFLGGLYDATGDLRYRSSYLAAATWLLNAQVATAHGMMFPSEEGGDENLIDFVWGFSGLANEFYEPHKSAASLAPARTLYARTFSWINNTKIAEDGGYAWPHTIEVVPAGGRTADVDPAVDTARSGRAREVDGTIVIDVPRVSLQMEDRPNGLELYDAGGRRVVVLGAPESIESTRARWRWDGRDDRGRLVRQGVYFAHVSPGNGPRARDRAPVRVVVLR